MRIGVVREVREAEARVALVPGSVSALTALGYGVVVEPGAGLGAGATDADYASAGAVVDERAVEDADVVLAVQPLVVEQVRRLRRGATTISFLPTAQVPEVVRELRDLAVTSFALELVPRTGRAQPCDALTSQAVVAGYRGAVVAAGMLRRPFPPLLTAGGSEPPAEVLVLGAGVAGLQAVATARRLGAAVTAYDVRPAAAEEIRSLGARALELDLEPLEGAAAYTREVDEERAARQRELLGPHVGAADALITTAAVPGRTAPLLVSTAMVERMRPGSVVVDLAADSGGNVEGSVAGEVVRIGGATVWGGHNVPAQVPGPASRLLAQNLVHLVTLMTVAGHEAPPGTFRPDWEDDLVAACCVTRDGAIVHDPTRVALEGPGGGALP